MIRTLTALALGAGLILGGTAHAQQPGRAARAQVRTHTVYRPVAPSYATPYAAPGWNYAPPYAAPSPYYGWNNGVYGATNAYPNNTAGRVAGIANTVNSLVNGVPAYNYGYAPQPYRYQTYGNVPYYRPW